MRRSTGVVEQMFQIWDGAHPHDWVAEGITPIDPADPDLPFRRLRSAAASLGLAGAFDLASDNGVQP